MALTQDQVNSNLWPFYVRFTENRAEQHKKWRACWEKRCTCAACGHDHKVEPTKEERRAHSKAVRHHDGIERAIFEEIRGIPNLSNRICDHTIRFQSCDNRAVDEKIEELFPLVCGASESGCGFIYAPEHLVDVVKAHLEDMPGIEDVDVSKDKPDHWDINWTA